MVSLASWRANLVFAAGGWFSGSQYYSISAGFTQRIF